MERHDSGDPVGVGVQQGRSRRGQVPQVAVQVLCVAPDGADGECEP